MAKSVSKKILKYTVIFEPAKEGGYVVSVPALPGCVSQGETFEQASEMIKDAQDFANNSESNKKLKSMMK